MSAFISAGLLANIPTLPTRRALMVLDLQKDFTGSNGKCYVPNIDEFVGDLLAVLPVFRDAGDLVFWVSTEFKCKRPVLDPESGSDSIVLGETDYENDDSDSEDEQDDVVGVDTAQARSSRKLKKKGPPPVAQDVEAFLSSALKPQQRCCFPGSEGAEYMDRIEAAIDRNYDDEIQKSQYSAFKRDLRNDRDSSILSTLQANLVTELFLCGSMSNISVYATALDAVRHGFKVTIIEDAVGYRSERRHEEAMRQMADLMGANGVTCAELVGEFEENQTDRRALAYQAKKSGTPIRKSREPGEDYYSKSSSPQITASSPPTSTPATQATIPSSAATSPAPLLSAVSEVGISTLHCEDEKENKHPASNDKLKRSESRSSKAGYDDECKDKAERKISPKRDTRGKVLEPTSVHDFISSEVDLPVGASADLDRGCERYKNADVEKSSADTPFTRSRANSKMRSRTSLEKSPSAHKVRVRRRRSPHVEQSRATSSFATPASDENHLNLDRPEADSVLEEPVESADIEMSESVPQPQLVVETAFSTATTISDPYHRPRPKDAIMNPIWRGPNDAIGVGDSSIQHNLPFPVHSDTIFERLRAEVAWEKMYHKSGPVPRLVAVQGDVDEYGTMPIYRHPADESPALLPFSETILLVRDVLRDITGQNFNHALIQLYRNGEDGISEHADKTLDIRRDSKICNVSFGAERVMTLRSKSSRSQSHSQAQSQPSNPTQQSTQPTSIPARITQKIPLPHSSLFTLGPETNKRFLHGIRPDKRPPSTKSDLELAFNGERISLTFREIETFVSRDGLIWGQGAKGKSRADARAVTKVEGEEGQEEWKRLIEAFGRENREAEEFEWESTYGRGFDVVG